MQIRISGGLLASVLCTTGLTLPFLILPGSIILDAGQEEWLSILLGALFGLAVSLFVVWVACWFPDRDPVGAITRALGRWAAFPLRLLYGAWNQFIFILGLYEIQSFIVTVMLEKTPEWVVYCLIVLVVFYAVYKGLEPVVRLTFATILPIILIVLLLPLALLREFSILQVDPFLWHGWDGVLRSAVKAAYWFGDHLIILSLVPHLNSKVSPYRWTIIGTVGAALLLALTVLLVSLTFGSELPSRLLYPGFELLAIISLTEGIERIHVGIIVFGIAACIAKLATNLYAAVEEASALLGGRWRTAIALVLAALGVVGAYYFSGPLMMADLVRQPGWQYSHLGAQVLILLLLSGGAFAAKQRRGRTRHG